MTDKERDRVLVKYWEPGNFKQWYDLREPRPDNWDEDFLTHENRRVCGIHERWPDYSDPRNAMRLLDLAHIEIQISLIPGCLKWRAVSNSDAVDFFFEGETPGEAIVNCAYAIAVAANNEKEGNDG